MSLPRKPSAYWDACAWIALIQQEHGRFEVLDYFRDKAEAGDIEIWTSAFTLAEVFKRPCGPAITGQPLPQKGLAVADDKNFEDYLLKPWVQMVQVDIDVGTLARRLLRRYNIRKPQDAIHLATALFYNIDELHTFDGEDLLKLDGKIRRRDKMQLRICPPTIPPSTPAPMADLPLFQASGSVPDGSNQTPKAPVVSKESAPAAPEQEQGTERPAGTVPPSGSGT